MTNIKKLLVVILLSLLTNSSQMRGRNEQLQKTAKFNNRGINEVENVPVLSQPPVSNYISSYNYYYSNDFGNDFILADTLDQSSFQKNIFEIKLINNTNQFYDYGSFSHLSNEKYVLEFLCHGTDNMQKSFYVPSVEEVTRILNKATKIDKTSENFGRLITSLTYEATYKHSTNSIALCNIVNTNQLVDNQAPLDNFISAKNQLDSILPYGTSSLNTPSSDNNIVNLLGKSIFTNTGTYQKAGSEWGFYAKTSTDQGNNLLTSVLVYDIKTTKTDSVNPDIVSISPVLSMDYKYNYDSNIVYQYSANNYCLANPSYKAGIKYIVLPNSNSNFTPINYGETNYDQKSDNGYCIGARASKLIGQAKSYSGKVDYMNQTMIFLGNVALGAATSGLSLPAQVVLNASYTLLANVTSNIIKEKTNYVDFAVNQQNGKLIRDTTVIDGSSNFDEVKKNNQFHKIIGFDLQNSKGGFNDSNNTPNRKNPMLFKDSSDSINYLVQILSSQLSDEYLAQISHYFSADILNDSTWFFNQNPEYIGTASSEWSYVYGKDFNSKDIEITKQTDDTIIAFGKSKSNFVKLTPKKTGVYDIILHDMPSDTTFILSNLTKNGSYKYETDPWSISRRLPSENYLKYNVSLTAGSTYSLGFYRDINGYKRFGTARLSIFESDQSSISSGDSKYDSNYVYREITNYYGYNIINQFIPKQDGQYTITACPLPQSNTKDTYLSILDENFNIIMSDDDGWGDRIAGARINLVANKEYYVSTRFYGSGSTGSYRVNIFKQVFIPELRGVNLTNEFSLAEFGSEHSTQYLLVSQSQKRNGKISAFWASNNNSTYNYIKLTLFNEKMEQLSEATDIRSSPFNYSFNANKLYVLRLSTITSSQKGVSLKFQEQ